MAFFLPSVCAAGGEPAYPGGPGGYFYMERPDEYEPDLFYAFNRVYGTLWTLGEVDQATKEVGRLRNAFVVDCGL